MGGAAEAWGGVPGGGRRWRLQNPQPVLQRKVVANEAPVHSCGGWVEGGWAQQGGQWERRLWSGLQGEGGRGGGCLLLFLIWNIQSSDSGFGSWFQRSSFPIIPNAAALI